MSSGMPTARVADSSFSSSSSRICPCSDSRCQRVQFTSLVTLCRHLVPDASTFLATAP